MLSVYDVEIERERSSLSVVQHQLVSSLSVVQHHLVKTKTSKIKSYLKCYLSTRLKIDREKASGINEGEGRSLSANSYQFSSVEVPRIVDPWFKPPTNPPGCWSLGLITAYRSVFYPSYTEDVVRVS